MQLAYVRSCTQTLHFQEIHPNIGVKWDHIGHDERVTSTECVFLPFSLASHRQRLLHKCKNKLKFF